MLIHIKNLSQDVSLGDLKGIFGEFGVVISASIEQEQVPGGTMRVGFIDMPLRDEGLAAVKSLNGSRIKGQEIIAEEINEREKTMEMQRSGK